MKKKDVHALIAGEEAVNMAMYGATLSSVSAVSFPVVARVHVYVFDCTSVLALASTPATLTPSTPSVLMSHYLTNLVLKYKVAPYTSDYTPTHAVTVGSHMLTVSLATGGR